jgi:hypothetical protein
MVADPAGVGERKSSSIEASVVSCRPSSGYLAGLGHSWRRNPGTEGVREGPGDMRGVTGPGITGVLGPGLRGPTMLYKDREGSRGCEFFPY